MATMSSKYCYGWHSFYTFQMKISYTLVDYKRKSNKNGHIPYIESAIPLKKNVTVDPFKAICPFSWNIETEGTSKPSKRYGIT